MKILSGRIGGSYVDSDWTLEDEVTGVRTITKPVNFGSSFVSPPHITLGINQLDADQNRNVRVQVYPGGITNNGFDVTFKTWWDSKIYSVFVDWLAYGS